MLSTQMTQGKAQALAEVKLTIFVPGNMLTGINTEEINNEERKDKTMKKKQNPFISVHSIDIYEMSTVKGVEVE